MESVQNRWCPQRTFRNAHIAFARKRARIQRAAHVQWPPMAIRWSSDGRWPSLAINVHKEQLVAMSGY